MRREVGKYDADRIKFATRMSNSYIEATIKLAKNFEMDPEKGPRRKALECKRCYYSTSIAGQAITEYNCGICNKELTWGNTATPSLCQDCAKEHDLCITCAADRELRPRRTLWTGVLAESPAPKPVKPIEPVIVLLPRRN